MSQKKGPGEHVVEDEDEESDEEDEEDILKRQFFLYATWKVEDPKGTHILLSQSDIWMRQAGVIKGRQLTTTDTGICFFKFKKYRLNYEEYLGFLVKLADYKKIPIENIIQKLITCGPPMENNPNAADKTIALPPKQN